MTLSHEPLRHGFTTVRDSPETPEWVEIARGPQERPATNENRAVRFGSAWATLSVRRTDLKQLCEWLENAPRHHENMVSEGVLNLPAPESVTEAPRKMLPVPREITEAIVPERLPTVKPHETTSETSNRGSHHETATNTLRATTILQPTVTSLHNHNTP